jgi:hypothetical protein
MVASNTLGKTLVEIESGHGFLVQSLRKIHGEIVRLLLSDGDGTPKKCRFSTMTSKLESDFRGSSGKLQPYLTIGTGDLWEDAHDRADQMKESHGEYNVETARQTTMMWARRRRRGERRAEGQTK